MNTTMTAKKKKVKKLKLDKEQVRLAQRYEKAWHKLYYKLTRWKQSDIIDNPDGRCAKELAHQVALLAESDTDLN